MTVALLFDGSQSLRTLSALFIVLTAACSERNASTGDWVGERETRGDTVVVTTTRGSVWSQAVLVEDLRIGTLDGPDEVTFGRVDEIAPDAHGGVYVFDGLAPALRYYDANGQFVQTLGGKGSGPGEYRDASLGVAVRRDGRIIMRDPRNNRINVYNPDGRPSDHWPVASGLFTGNALIVDTLDHMYLRILLEEPRRSEPWNIGLLHLDSNGRLVDSIAAPIIPNEPTSAGGAFIPSKQWTRSPFGFTVVGVPRHYSFDIHFPGGKVTRVVKVYDPVELHPEERAEHEALKAWMQRTQGQFMTSEMPDIPRIKPAYYSIDAAADGRIWIRRHVSAEKQTLSPEPPQSDPNRPPVRSWREPAVYDVFESDGIYLGEVRLPAKTSIHWFGREYLWGVRRGEMDENYVVRLKLQTQQ